MEYTGGLGITVVVIGSAVREHVKSIAILRFLGTCDKDNCASSTQCAGPVNARLEMIFIGGKMQCNNVRGTNETLPRAMRGCHEHVRE